MKTVLHATGMPSSKYGGLERFNIELCKQLSAKGYHSVFIYESFPESEEFVKDITAQGAEIVTLPARGHAISFCKEFVKLVRKYKPEIVHAHFPKAKFYAVPIAHFLGVKKLFYTCHSTVGFVKDMKLHTRLWFKYVHRFCKVIGISEKIVEDSKTNWGDDIRIEKHYLGTKSMEGDRFSCRAELNIPDDELTILTVSNFNHVKGLDILCCAVKILKDRNAFPFNAKVRIVGQPEEDKKQLAILMDELGISENIIMHGISNEVAKYLAAADIYCQPSRHEGLPLSIMEACSAGLPIIATNVGGIPEIVTSGSNGLLFESENASEFANSLQVLINGGNLRNDMGEKSRECYFKTFSLESSIRGLINYYGIQ